MTTWTSEELAKIGTAEELQIASRQRDTTLRNTVTIRVVRHGDDLYVDLTETKLICDPGSCGECTVLLDGESVVSCMVPAITAQRKAIRTVFRHLAEGTTSVQVP